MVSLFSIIRCVFDWSMVSDYKVFALWPMASPWNNIQELYEVAFVWTHFLRLLLLAHFALLALATFVLFWYDLSAVDFPLHPCFHLEEGKHNGFFGTMSCNLETAIGISPLLILQALASVFLANWLYKQLDDVCELSLRCDHGFLFYLDCCWSGIWTVCLFNQVKLCNVIYSDLFQSHSAVGPSPAHDEAFIAFSIPEACAAMLVFYWICCSTCWVWRSVAQLICPSGSSPGSSHGLFLTLACCWKAIGTFCPLSPKWSCVASSQELWQSQSLVDKAQDEKVFGPSLSEAIPCYSFVNWFWWVFCSLFLCFFPLFQDVLLFGSFCGSVAFSFTVYVCVLCLIMLSSCKVKALRPRPVHCPISLQGICSLSVYLAFLG